ncbi:hypothetical protein GCM10028818_59150 [Spirosoma horti]
MRNVQVLNSQQIEGAWDYYKEQSWLDEMRQQIANIDSTQIDFSNYVGEAIFNIRFKPEEVTIYSDPIKIGKENPVVSFQRYKFIGVQDVVVPEVMQEESFHFRTGEYGTSDRVLTSEYDRPAKTIQLAKQHNNLCQKLYKYLVSVYGSNNVGRENRTLYNTSIDIVRRDGTKLYFYEIKTYPSLKQNIREAIGQLLEYSYWPMGQLAHELIIVTELPADQETLDYIYNLRVRLNLPISYQQFDLSNNKLQE